MALVNFSASVRGVTDSALGTRELLRERGFSVWWFERAFIIEDKLHIGNTKLKVWQLNDINGNKTQTTETNTK